MVEKLKQIVLLAGVCSLLYACEREEDPIQPYDRGGVETVQIAMGENYGTQVWYDLGTQQVVSTNERSAWDIAFDCSATSNNIFLNTSVAMKAAPVPGAVFEDVTSDAGLFYRPDHPEGHSDSLSFANWETTPAVWVLDLGFRASGTSRGKRKVSVEMTADGAYSIRHAKLDGTEEGTAIIQKDDRFNWLAFSFTTNSSIEIEPIKETYDLCFTTYTTVFYDPYLPYLVNGVLLNPHNTQAVRDTMDDFSALNLDILADRDLTTQANIIGYNWKSYNLAEGAFTVFPQIVYLVQDSEGFYYKMHFIDFYDANGIKGHPLFEMQRL